MWQMGPAFFFHKALTVSLHSPNGRHVLMSDSRFASSQWEAALLCNDVHHWLGSSLESAMSPAVRVVQGGNAVYLLIWPPRMSAHGFCYGWRGAPESINVREFHSRNHNYEFQSIFAGENRTEQKSGRWLGATLATADNMIVVSLLAE